MDTDGHHELSEIGEKLLKPALERANHKKMRIGAFYLGNWLTDVAQCVDPRAYRDGLAKIEKLNTRLSELFSRLDYDAPSWIKFAFGSDLFDAALQGLRRRLQEAREALMAQIRFLLEEGKNGGLAQAFKWYFHYLGYIRFVLDKDGSMEFQMDPEIYDKIFENHFNQYFPHEHLDRPETGPREFASAKAQGPFNTHSKKVATQGKAGGDLYEYLRQDILLAAGQLADLDGGPESEAGNKVSWAAGTFHPRLTYFTDDKGQKQAIDDKNYAWNHHLAMLGKALHAVEDFFAHSTFVEHASTALPASYTRFQRWEEQETLARRLKELPAGFDNDKDDWRKLRDDTHIVTGYFDIWDTLISLGHMFDKLFHRPHDKLGASVDSVVEYDYARLLRDTLELCDKPLEVWDAPINDPASDEYDADEANTAVKWLRDQGGRKLALAEGREKYLNWVTHWMITQGPLKNMPASVKQSFTGAVQALGKMVGVGTLLISTFRALKSIVSLIHSPVEWLKKYVPEFAYEQLKKYGEVYLKNLIFEYLGAKRIGCHSLIAKDGGPELFHKGAMECAKAVHWYVVYTLTRHSREPVVHVTRLDQEAQQRNKLYRWEWIDWLELVEYFLDHPLSRISMKKGERILSASILHVTRWDPHSKMSPDSLASLAREYAPSFKATPEGPKVFTWEEIADANFPTRGMTTAQRRAQINKVLKANNQGLAVEDGVNFAFRPGLRIIIPYQRATSVILWGKEVERRWWHPVITQGYKQITTWFEKGELSAKAPADAHRWYPIPQRQQAELAQKAAKDRGKLEKAYE